MEVGIERCRDGPDEHTSRRRDADVCIVYLNQAILRHGVKPVKRVGELGVKGLRQGRDNRVLRNLHLTHQLIDDESAPPVFSGKPPAPHGGHVARLQSGVIGPQAFRVLRICVMKLTDGRYPKAKDFHGGVHPVSLNVAVDRAGVPCLYKGVMGTGEVVPPDRHIPQRLQSVGQGQKELHTLLGARKHVCGNEPLVFHHPPHVRIAKHREAVGLQDGHLFERGSYRIGRLMR